MNPHHITLMCLTAQFYYNAPESFKGRAFNRHASAACDDAFIIQCVYVRNYLPAKHTIIKHNCNIYLETVAKLSKWFLALLFIIGTLVVVG